MWKKWVNKLMQSFITIQRKLKTEPWLPYEGHNMEIASGYYVDNQAFLPPQAGSVGRVQPEAD